MVTLGGQLRNSPIILSKLAYLTTSRYYKKQVIEIINKFTNSVKSKCCILEKACWWINTSRDSVVFLDMWKWVRAMLVDNSCLTLNVKKKKKKVSRCFSSGRRPTSTEIDVEININNQIPMSWSNVGCLPGNWLRC